MKNINNIICAHDQAELISVKSVRPLPNHQLWLRFTTGETKYFDMAPLLYQSCYQPLKDPAVFAQVYLDYGIPTWLEETIDIAPETIYEAGLPC